MSTLDHYFAINTNITDVQPSQVDEITKTDDSIKYGIFTLKSHVPNIERPATRTVAKLYYWLKEQFPTLELYYNAGAMCKEKRQFTFFLKAINTILELDLFGGSSYSLGNGGKRGESHRDRSAKEIEKMEVGLKNGYRFIRIYKLDYEADPDRVHEKIRTIIEQIMSGTNKNNFIVVGTDKALAKDGYANYKKKLLELNVVLVTEY